VTVSDWLAVWPSLDYMTGTKTDGEKVDVWTRSAWPAVKPAGL
jgi:hypothetical protein